MSDDNRLYELSRRKVLGGLGLTGFAAAGAGLGTSAFLNDTETFENNVLTAGTLDLLVGYYSYWDQGNAGTGSVSGTADGPAVTSELTDIKPGDNGVLAFCPRIETNPAYLWLCGELTANDENGINEPESEVDSTPETGELAQNIVLDVDYCDLGDVGEAFDPGDVTKVADVWEGTLAEFLTAIETGVPLDGDANSGDGETGFLAPGDQACYVGSDAGSTNHCLCIAWEVPTDVGNEIQSDSLTFDLEFHAEQCRHNDGTHNPCADGVECADCSFDPAATGDGASTLLSVGPDATSGFPDIDARVRVDSALGNAGDLTAANFAVCEDGCGQTLDSVVFESGGVADIVVVFDDTGSMYNEIDAMKSQVSSLTADIEGAGIDARYALVSFKDKVDLDTDFTDAATFQTAVDGLSAGGGGDTPEDNIDALAVGTGHAATEDDGDTLSAFRSGAQRIIIDITDVGAYDSTTDSRARFTQAEIEGFLDDGNFTYYAVAPSSVSSPVSKRTIANNVDNGTWIDITSADFDVILNDIVGSITDPAYVLSYTTTNPTTDGSTRIVDIEIDDPDEGLLYEEGDYTAPT